MKHSRHRATCAEIELRFSIQQKTRITCREGALVRKRPRQALSWKLVPVCSVRGREQQKFPLHRIAQREALLIVRAYQRIQEKRFSLVAILLFPRCPAICRLVNARLFSLAAGHHINRCAIKRLHTAKVQVIRPGNAHQLPRLSRVRRAHNRPFGPCRPNDFSAAAVRHAYAPKICVRAGGPDGPPRSASRRNQQHACHAQPHGWGVYQGFGNFTSWGKDRSWRLSCARRGASGSSLPVETPRARKLGMARKTSAPFSPFQPAPGPETLPGIPVPLECACVACALCSRWSTALVREPARHAR